LEKEEGQAVGLERAAYGLEKAACGVKKPEKMNQD
jgi:hypothetical protein